MNLERVREALGPYLRASGELVARPRTARELIEVLHIMTDQQAVLGRDVQLDRTALDSLGELSFSSMTLDVGAGASLMRVETHLATRGLTLGPLWPSASSLTVAEVLEGRFGGLRSIPGGRLEPLCARVNAVLSDGRSLTSSPGPRSAAGSDLLGLVLGGEGRFALCTSATLRAFESPVTQRSACWSFETSRQAVEALVGAISDGCWLTEATVERAAQRWHLHVAWAGSAGGVEREAQTLHGCAASGLSVSAVPSLISGPEVELDWQGVLAALTTAPGLRLHRLTLSSVLAQGVEAMPPARTWEHAAALRSAFDPHGVFGGAP